MTGSTGGQGSGNTRPGWLWFVAIITPLVLGGIWCFAWKFSYLASGPFWFGVVIGFVTYRTLKHTTQAGISDIASVIGAVGGATIVGLFPVAEGRFNDYAIGLFLGFFAFLVVFQFIGLATSTDQATEFTD